MDIRHNVPGVQVGKIPFYEHEIIPVATSITAFVGRAPIGPVDEALSCSSFADFEGLYGGLSLDYPMSYAVRDFFNNNGSQAVICRLYEPDPGDTGADSEGQHLTVPTYLGHRDRKTGIYLLEKIPKFNLLCIPPDRRLLDTVPLAQQDLDVKIRQAAAAYCAERGAIFIADPPAIWESHVTQGNIAAIATTDLGITGETAPDIEAERNVAVYFPRVIASDPLLNDTPCLFPACGMIAGVIAATDVSRGVWSSPAGVNAVLQGVTKLAVNLSDAQNGVLNQIGVNCLRSFPIIGPVVWGARTLRGADQFEEDYKYLPVRRLKLFLESSIYEGTRWAVSEPNNERLWSSVSLSVNSFLMDLARQGAFYNCFVACDQTTTTPADIAAGRLNIQIGIAPVRPAEFVIFTVQQTGMAASGQV